MVAVQAVGEDAEAEWSSSQAHLAEDQEVSEVAASVAEAVVASLVAVDLAEAAEAEEAGNTKSGGRSLRCDRHKAKIRSGAFATQKL